MNKLQKIHGHLKTINEHKAKVTGLCFRCGLVKQGLLHDLSKYSPVELKTGFRYYQGYRSPIDAQKEAEGYSFSWLHHKGRNPHHWEFWVDHSWDGVIATPMKFNYVAEMFCDRIAACKTYQKEKYTDWSGIDYYLRGRSHILIHPETDRQIVYLLMDTAKRGLSHTTQLIRALVKEYRKTGEVHLPADADELLEEAALRQKQLEEDMKQHPDPARPNPALILQHAKEADAHASSAAPDVSAAQSSPSSEQKD